MSIPQPALIIWGDSPIIAAAIHDGHAVSPQVAERLALSEDERLREEDPFTGGWTSFCPRRVIGLRSRFEVDLNRPRQGAVYLTPQQAWGLNVWKEPPPPDLVERLLKQHEVFYTEMRRLLDEQVRRSGPFVVYDIHSYNHRRNGPGGAAAEASENPDINIGTGTMPPGRWGGLLRRFMSDLREQSRAHGRELDVRENVRFTGGYFAQWIHRNYPETGCALAIEVKKFFMDEWTGEPFASEIERVGRILAATVPGVLEELEATR